MLTEAIDGFRPSLCSLRFCVCIVSDLALDLDDDVLVSYPSGEGRGGSGLTVAFHGDQLYESFDTERGECEDLDLFSAIDPDDAIFGLHADGEIMEATCRFAQLCRNAINGFDGVDLVQLHGQAA